MRSSLLQRSMPALVLVFGLTASTTAFGQATVRVRGSVDSADQSMVSVRTREGSVTTVKLPDPPRVSAVVKASVADIKPGTFIGTTSLPGPDGTLRAIAIALLPEAARASGGFHSAWDLQPESTMTNATVADAASVVDGEKLRVTYKDGEKVILVSPETSIVGLAPATIADLKPGVRVVVSARKADDGSLVAVNVVCGRDGVDPPM